MLKDPLAPMFPAAIVPELQMQDEPAAWTNMAVLKVQAIPHSGPALFCVIVDHL